jgi:hypothetical protein
MFDHPLMTTLFFICVIGFGVFWLGAIFIWAIWIRSYLGPKKAVWIFGGAMLQDYRHSVETARSQNHKPWFLKAFSILSVTGIVFFLFGLLASVFRW